MITLIRKPYDARDLRHVGTWENELGRHVDTWVCKHTRQNDTWGTLPLEHVNTPDMLTCEHVSTQGTLTRENILGKQSTQFSRLVKTYTDVNLKEQTFRRASNSLFRKMNIMKLKPIKMCSLDSFPTWHGVS